VRARAAKAEAGFSCRLDRVQGSAQDGAAVNVGTRVQLELGDEVTPVRRQHLEGRLPFGRDCGARDLRGRLRLARPDEAQLAGDSRGVDPPEQTPRSLGSDPVAAAGDVEADRVAREARTGRPKQRSGAFTRLLGVDSEAQPDVAPPRIQAALDGVPLLDEPHGANRTLRPMAKVEHPTSLAKAELGDVLREMLLIRRFEEKVEERFRAGELPGFLHVAIGQEACAVGVCRALEDGDIIASTHRAHGHTLAKGTHPNELMAELYGKTEGCSRGYGGSMHLYDVERGNMGANAVVGGGLPQITGAALAFKLRGEPRVAVAFFGDGATNIGTFHEALNLAQLWQVPAVFVLEDNKWAESTPESQHSPIRDLSERAKAFGMKTLKVDGQNVEAVYKATRQALDHARSGKGPMFLHLDCVRFHGHYIGDPQVYRDRDEARKLAETRDPIGLLRAKLEVSDEDFATLDAEVTEIVEASVEFAKNGTDPAPEDAMKNVYA